MAVVFCGKSALWLWRSGARLSGPIDADRADEVLASAVVDRELVLDAVWLVNKELGRRWCGPGRPEVLSRIKARRGRAGTRVRSVHTTPELRRIGNTCHYVIDPGVAMAQCAEEFDLDTLVLLGNELCGTYGTAVDMGARTCHRREPRTSTRDLARFIANAGRGTLACDDAVRYMLDGCASPMESKIALLFVLPVKRGGCGLPKPMANRDIALTPEAQALCGSDRLSPDFCWPDRKLIVEYDSNRHHFDGARDLAAQAERDRRRLNAFAAMGYQTMSMTRATVRAWDSYFAFMKELRERLGMRWCEPTLFTTRLMKDEHAKIVNLVDPMAGVFWYGRGAGAGMPTNSWAEDSLI